MTIRKIYFLFLLLFTAFSAGAGEDLSFIAEEIQNSRIRPASFFDAYQAKIHHSFNKAREHFSLIFSSAGKEGMEKISNQAAVPEKSVIKQLQQEVEKVFKDPSGLKKSDSPLAKEVTGRLSTMPVDEEKKVQREKTQSQIPDSAFERRSFKKNGYQNRFSGRKGSAFERRSFKKRSFETKSFKKTPPPAENPPSSGRDDSLKLSELMEL
ncbi:MAG: hypothetical protein IKA79_09820 [Lentisphaeria bacterium]|nr:hypothetical protein [Lentisphaeria bacterium]